ncbi:MAG: DUF3562 domain-containing protein [Nitrospirae bacterium]|nr:DUF3562 domain-containing protein [Candidatus Manganitrophaceae bacterium]
MAMVKYYEDDKEQARHFSAKQRLARELRIPLEEIGALYERILKELRKQARIKEFLSILVSRRVRDLLRPKKAA